MQTYLCTYKIYFTYNLSILNVIMDTKNCAHHFADNNTVCFEILDVLIQILAQKLPDII